jgi:hypothetical protein
LGKAFESACPHAIASESEFITPSRRRLGISEEKIWVQRTPIGQALVVYWDTEDPQRTLREIANAQDEFGKQFKQLIHTAAPALDLSGEQPLSNERLFSWQPS